MTDENSGWYPRVSARRAVGMKPDEVRSTCLIYDGTDITGNEYNSMQQRHTKFYRLDIEYIKSFGDGD